MCLGFNCGSRKDPIMRRDRVNGHPTAALPILGGSFDMINDQHLYGTFRGYQLQAELLLYRGEESRKIGIRVRGIVRVHFKVNL